MRSVCRVDPGYRQGIGSRSGGENQRAAKVMASSLCGAQLPDPVLTQVYRLKAVMARRWYIISETFPTVAQLVATIVTGT